MVWSTYRKILTLFGRNKQHFMRQRIQCITRSQRVRDSLEMRIPSTSTNKFPEGATQTFKRGTICKIGLWNWQEKLQCSRRGNASMKIQRILSKNWRVKRVKPNWMYQNFKNMRLDHKLVRNPWLEVTFPDFSHKEKRKSTRLSLRDFHKCPKDLD